MEQRILQKVDSCFALSDELMKTRRASSGENHFLPMGVDTDLFRGSREIVPEQMKTIKKPIAGFFGQIGAYVDLEIIMRAARAFPEVSFVLLGRAHVSMSGTSNVSNVHFLGEVPYEEVPRFASGFDIAVNPRVVNKLTLAMNPLKILEYLSLGLPVVSTDLPEVRKFKDVVYIAQTPDQFIELIGKALRDTDSDNRVRRRKVAEQFSWGSIAENVSRTIDRIDRAKHSPGRREDGRHGEGTSQDHIRRMGQP